MDWMWEMKEKEVATMPTGFMLVKQYGGWCHSGLYETPEENWGGEKIDQKGYFFLTLWT